MKPKIINVKKKVKFNILIFRLLKKFNACKRKQLINWWLNSTIVALFTIFPKQHNSLKKLQPRKYNNRDGNTKLLTVYINVQCLSQKLFLWQAVGMFLTRFYSMADNLGWIGRKNSPKSPSEQMLEIHVHVVIMCCPLTSAVSYKYFFLFWCLTFYVLLTNIMNPPI